VQDYSAQSLEMEIRHGQTNGHANADAPDRADGSADESANQKSEREKFEQFPGIHWLHDVTFRPPLHQLESLANMISTKQARYL
jgi:hypothetical protein